MLPSPRNSVKAFRSRLQEAPRLPVVDRAVQKEELNKIFRDLQTAGLRESPKFARRLLEFLENIVKERGVALHDILGQHVANNVIFTVMECVLLPSLREFSDLVARRQPLAGGRGAHSTTKNSENHLEVRAKKIRTDVVRPWRALVDTVHRNLPPSLKLQHVSGLPSSLSSSLAGPSGSTRDAVANVNSVVGGVAGLEANSFRRPVDSMERTFTNEDTPQFQATGGKEENFNCFRHMWTSAPNHTYLPLLWKNAVPFNTVVQHILWVLQTETLSSMFGQDFAHILLQLLSFRGYLSNLHPRFIRQLAMRLLLLVERTAYESYAVNSNTSGMSKLEVNQSVGDGEANLPGGSEDDGVPSPSVDEGTTYAALLAQLFRAPHLLSALTPCEDAAVAGEKKAVEEGENITLPIIMQRLVKVTLRRHHRPTSALRMEANLLVATRLLVGAACDDYPQTSRNALVLLKLLCHTFYTTTRRDGWRVEALELLTTLVSVCFSAVLGWSARNDIERHRPVPTRYYSDEDVAETTSHNKNRKLNCPNGLQNTTTKPDDIEDSESPYSPRISPEFIALLHETVFPFVQQLFTVTRSEFNFVSHRELFHFPCTPLSSLFEFGAVVLYLACVTFDAYTVLPSAVKAPCGYSCASHPLAQQSNGSHSMGNGRGIKRPRSATEAATNEGKIRVHSEAMYARAHPSAVILQLFHKHFFLESGGGSHSSAVEMARDVSSGELGSTNAVGDASGGGNQLLGAGRVADSVEGSIVGVVVHNDARESALLMLHLLAQPCATLGFTEEQCTLLVERCIIPLFPYHGVRLESLLLAVLHVVGPRTSVACQQELFRWLVRRYLPTETTQRDEESRPKEQVYTLLSSFLQRRVVGQWPLFVCSEERIRLQTIAHFDAITSRIYAVTRTSASYARASNAKSGQYYFTPTYDPAVRIQTSLVASQENAATPLVAAQVPTAYGHNINEIGLTDSLFCAMVEFLSSYHHYGAMSTHIISLHRQYVKACARCDPSKVPRRERLTDMPAAVTRLSSGIAFIVAGLSHAVCFFPHDGGVVWKHDSDTPESTAKSTALLQGTLRCAEDYILALCLVVMESSLGYQHSLVSTTELGAVEVAVDGRVDTIFSLEEGSGRGTISLQRMKQLLTRSRRMMDSSFITPDKHLPASVCNVAGGCWLLLQEFLAASREAKFSTSGIAESGDAYGLWNGDAHNLSNEEDGEPYRCSGCLRRGDVPFSVLGTLSVEVTRAVVHLSDLAKAIDASADGKASTERDKQAFLTQEVVNSNYCTLCLHAIQLLHLLLRLYRLGIWHLPEDKGTRSGGTGIGSKVPKRKNINDGEPTDGASHTDLGEESMDESNRHAEDDLSVLSNLSCKELFNEPAFIFQKLPTPSGKLYYAIMWVCLYLSTKLPGGPLLRHRALLRAVLLLLHDVGWVLVSQPLALWEPRQVILSFVSAVCRYTQEGVLELATWNERNTVSLEEAAVVHVTLRLSCRVLGAILSLVRHRRAMYGAAESLVDPASVTAVVVGILEKSELIPSSEGEYRSDCHSEGNAAEPTATKKPFLPFVIPSVDGLAYLLHVLRGSCGNPRARTALRSLLHTLFMRYRHALSEYIFTTLSCYPLYRSPCNTASAAESGVGPNEDDRGINRCEAPSGENMPGARQNVKGDLLLEEGELLESLVNQLNNSSQANLLPLTPQRQCAMISAIYGLLFSCDVRVAERLGKQLFSFFSPATPYIVRRHTALQVNLLFSRFGSRADVVLRELLFRAREGMLSASSMSCITSLRAVGEAAVAVPSMEAKVVRTLLECWATHGFVHRDLVTQCLEFIAKSTRGCVSGPFSGVLLPLGLDVHDLKMQMQTRTDCTGTDAQQLCTYHCERLLFDWLWVLGHPLEAFPVACFGYSSVKFFCKSFMHILVPLAILCSARLEDTGEREQGVLNECTSTAFMQPSGLLWRLVTCHLENMQQPGEKAEGREADAALRECLQPRQQLESVIVAYFSDIASRLLLLSTLSTPHTEGSGLPAIVCKEQLKQIGNLEEGEMLRSAGDSARVALEWLRSILSMRFASLVWYNSDSILCRLAELVGMLSPNVGLQEVHQAVKKLCSTVEGYSRQNLQCVLRDGGLDVGQLAINFPSSAVDSFFASCAGDHAYVLLQRLYIHLTHSVNRGSRRLMLIQLFKSIIMQWWSRELLEQVPCVLHTVLRMCGNMLMTCPDAHLTVCDVLTYTYSVVTPHHAPLEMPMASTRAIVAADAAFIATVMSSLSVESPTVASTWRNMTHINEGQQRGSSADAVRYICLDSDGDAESCGGEDEVVVVTGSQEDGEEYLSVGDASHNIKCAESCVHEILPLLKNTILVSGAPASSLYLDVASAVDSNRAAIVTLLQRHKREKEQRHDSHAILLAVECERALSGIAKKVYELCFRAARHVLAVVCSDNNVGVSSQQTTALIINTTTATNLCATNRDAQLSAFRLLRALCWCFVESGLESCVETLFSPTTDMQDLLDRKSLDDVLHHAYRQHIEQLYRLAFDTDARIAHVASTTLREWLCGSESDESGFAGGTVDECVTQLSPNGKSQKELWKRTTGTNVHKRRVVRDTGMLIKRTLELIRQSEEHSDQDDTCGSENQLLDGIPQFLNLCDLKPFHRRLTDDLFHIHALSADSVVENLHSLLDDSLWDALRVQEDELLFLRLFLIGLIRHYNLQARFSTVATVLNCILVPMQLTSRADSVVGGSGGVGSSGSSSITSFIENFLPIALLHVMLTRETTTQRSQRALWSRCLQECLFSRAMQFPRVTRLFLRALSVCRSVMMTYVRSRGVQPTVTENVSRHPNPVSGKAEAAPTEMFLKYVPSKYGELPVLFDMRDSYWLSDIDPLILAAASVTCHEPQLAVLFTELSGESLLGKGKGIPSNAIWTSLMPLCNSSAGVNTQKQNGSVLFPFLCPSEVDEVASDGRSRKLRSDTAQTELTQRLFDFCSAVHCILVDVKVILCHRERADNDYSSDTVDPTAIMLSSHTHNDREEHTTPWEESFLIQCPMRRIEREKGRGNWQAVLAILDRVARLGEAKGISRTRIAIEKANALMHLGDQGTAVHVLSTAMKQKLHASTFEMGNDSENGNTCLPEGDCSGNGNFDDESLQLRAALAGALWRCGRWNTDTLENSDYQQQHQLLHLLLPTVVSFDEGVYHSLWCMRRGQYDDARRWCVQAQQQLMQKIDVSNWRSVLLQTEALQDIENCSKPKVQSNQASSLPPRWVEASFSNVRMPYSELQLLDCLRQQLCMVFKQPKWWLAHLKGCSNRALRSNRPLLVQQWLSSHSDVLKTINSCISDSNGSDVCAVESTSLCSARNFGNLPPVAFLALVQARVEFACGHPHRAIATLQHLAPSSLRSSPFDASELVLPPLKGSPMMPQIIQQLVAWFMEAHIVPLSQLVTDPFIEYCSANDESGCCGLQFAQLCHTLTRDIAERLRSHNYRTLQESMESLRTTQVALQKRQKLLPESPGNTSEGMRLLRGRIHGIAAEYECDEKEVEEEACAYALYRRSALNAYARFLRLSKPMGDDNDILAVFGFVSLWLQQDEQYIQRDSKDATDAIIAKAIKHTPLHKFLPLYSQLVAQLGTSLDNKNLEELVRRVALAEPLHAVWPLLALANGDKFGLTEERSSAVFVVDREKVAIARRVLSSLKGTSHGAFGDRGISSQTEDPHNRILSDAEKLSASYMQLASYATDQRGGTTASVPANFTLVSATMRNLFIPPPTLTLPPCLFSLPESMWRRQYALLPRIREFLPRYSVPGGISAPKIVSCVLTNGHTVRQLLKSKDDLRQDSLIEQIFSLSNTLFSKKPSTRDLHMGTYNVVPLAPKVGLIEWVNDTISLECYLNSQSATTRTGAHERYFPTEITSYVCREMFKNAPKSTKHETLLLLYAKFTPALHYFFLEHFLTPREWLERRDAYIRSVAVSSMLGYIIGLGDRHPSNILLHKGRAELLQIDFGYAFDQAKLLHVPELVPFRLTPNIVDGLGVQGVEGPFRQHCESVLHVLRGQKELLMTILGACAHDPLARWAVLVAPQGKEDAHSAASTLQRETEVLRKKTTFAEAERVLSHVSEKIQGYESGELLNVRTHVHKLLQTAQSTELLSQMYFGWAPWV